MMHFMKTYWRMRLARREFEEPIHALVGQTISTQKRMSWAMRDLLMACLLSPTVEQTAEVDGFEVRMTVAPKEKEH